MNNNGEPKVPMIVAPPATSATIAPAIDSPAADVPVINVLTRAEIYAKQLELNAKRLGFNAKQLDLDDKQLKLDEQQRKLDDEQRKLNGQSSVSVVFELMASASARTPAIPVDAPTESISPCLPIAAMPRLLVAALAAARPTAAQEGKRPAPINELPESPIAPKRHRGKGQISNTGSTTGSSCTTGRSLSEKVAVERLIAALDVPAYFAPATGAPIFGNAPAAGILDCDISALIAPAAGATTFGNAPAVGFSAVDFSDLVAPATGVTTFGVAPAVGFSAVAFSDLIAPATGATTFGVAPAAGALAADISTYFGPAAGAPTFGVAPAASILDRDISALVAPAVGVLAFGDALAIGAPTFGIAPAIGISAVDISALVTPAAGATTFGVAPAAGILDSDISAYFSPAAGAPTFGDALAIGATTFGVAPAVSMPDLDISAFVAPAAGATTFGVAPAAGVLDRDISALVAPAAGTTTFGVAPAAGVLDRDILALVAPAASATMLGNAPAIGIPDLDISALIAPAAGAPTFGITPAIGVSDLDISDLFAPATSATTFGDAPAVGVSAFGVAPTVDVPTVNIRVSDSVTAAELLRTVYDVSGMLRDVSGRRVTSERLLVALGEAPYISLGYVLDAYRHIYGCELMPSSTQPQYCIATLARVVALEHWAPQLDEEDPAAVADLNILCRRDKELGALRQNYREQLGLANDPNAAVLGPRLCYVIVKMCSMSVDLLTGPVLRSMFLGATGLDLHSLNVATEKGVLRMEAESICHTVESWVGNIIKFIADDGNGLDGALSMVTDCNALFETRCGSAASDSTEVAIDMLMNNVLYSTLFLGNGEAKWEALCRCLVCFASKRIIPRTKKCLYQLSTSLQVQPGS